MPSLTLSQWLLGALCAAMVGVAKTGVPGVGILAVPLMVLAVGDARASVGWLLPILVSADVIAVLYYRRHANTRMLFGLLPWVLVGMGGGVLALGLGPSILRRVVGVIVLIMVTVHIAQRRRGGALAVGGNWHHAPRYGVAAGFATTVANAAGPVMNVYLLSKRLPKEEFVATGVWFFLVVNLTKVPLYASRGMITGTSLLFDLWMFPAVVVGAVSGRAIIRRLPQGLFEATALGLTAVAAGLLLVN